MTPELSLSHNVSIWRGEQTPAHRAADARQKRVSRPNGTLLRQVLPATSESRSLRSLLRSSPNKHACDNHRTASTHRRTSEPCGGDTCGRSQDVGLSTRLSCDDVMHQSRSGRPPRCGGFEALPFERTRGAGGVGCRCV